MRGRAVTDGSSATAEPPTKPATRTRGYAQTAGWGTRWAASQSLINKLATALGMLVVARALDPDEYGIASVVNTASSLVMVLPILVMGDVLISHQRHLPSVARHARSVMHGSTLLLTLFMLATAPLIAERYPQYPFGLVAALLAVCAMRPIAEAALVFPLTHMRLSLRYREIALINGFTRFGATALMVVWAIAWPTPAAIVVPQLLIAVSRGIIFHIVARRGPRGRRSFERPAWQRPHLATRIRRRLGREFGMASFAQYVHTVVSGLPLLIVSFHATKTEVGLFGFAIMLAPQWVGLFSAQIGVVLQPIFGRLRSEPSRQVRGFLRVLTLMAALTVPMSLLQAALAEPLIRLLFGEKWIQAVPLFVALSIGQTALFLLAPALALLKAQGRFGRFLVWQVAHVAVSFVVLSVVVRSYGAVGVAWADAAIWFVSIPMALLFAVRRVGVSMREFAAGMATPWITAAPISLGAWFAWRSIDQPTLTETAAFLAVVGPIASALSILAIRVTQPHVAAEMAPFMRRVLGRLPVLGPPLAEWFCTPPRGGARGDWDDSK